MLRNGLQRQIRELDHGVLALSSGKWASEHVRLPILKQRHAPNARSYPVTCDRCRYGTKMRTRTRVFGSAVIATIALGSCSVAGPRQSGPQGTVHGRVLVSGGPFFPPASPGPRTGTATVAISTDGREVARQSTSADQDFRFAVPPGHYRMSAIDAGQCTDVDVTVAGEDDQEVILTCSVK
jgi:hypothetical protein